jgi:predicted acetylornithine/succinylornithine family transaminase
MDRYTSSQIQEVFGLYEKYVQPTYGRMPVVFVRGAGVRLWDSEGRQYLDFVSGGRAGNGLGHNHPEVVAALQKQLDTLMFVSNDFHHPWAARLAQLLGERSAGRKAFFCNSGTEASEAAIKLARKWGRAQRGENCYEIITTERSFHGRTLGALAATAQPQYQQPFGRMVPGFTYVPFNDARALEAAIGPSTCAVYLEPIQGESGIYPADREYLRAVAAICHQHDLLFMVDEVQTGFGRTGKFWAFEHYGVEPDVIATAKALGGGLPIGVCLALPEHCALGAGDHGCTFGGNPMVTAAAVAALEALDKNGYVDNAAKQGEYILTRFRYWQTVSSIIKEARGRGLMIGLELSRPHGKLVIDKCLEKGLVIHGVGERILRLVPAVSITRAEVDEGLEILEEALHEVNPA